jgi:hypothetical protein
MNTQNLLEGKNVLIFDDENDILDTLRKIWRPLYIVVAQFTSKLEITCLYRIF